MFTKGAQAVQVPKVLWQEINTTPELAAAKLVSLLTEYL